jgi:hypothetical protein
VVEPRFFGDASAADAKAVAKAVERYRAFLLGPADSSPHRAVP